MHPDTYAPGDGPTIDDTDDWTTDPANKRSRAMLCHELLRAARDGDSESVEKLLKAGPSLESRRPFVVTLHSTPQSHDFDANTNKKLNKGNGLTALMYAAQSGSLKCCALLIAALADIEAQEEDGLRPIHFAASSGSPETCKLLVDANADTGVFDDNGFRAIDHVPLTLVTTKSEMIFWQNTFKPPASDKEDAKFEEVDLEVILPVTKEAGGAMQSEQKECEDS
jgi:hypothetical protein